jgi:hypothetical protein
MGVSPAGDEPNHGFFQAWLGPADDWWRAQCGCGLHLGARRDLDAIVTIGIDLATYPTLYMVKTGTSGALQAWQLMAGTDAEDAPGGIVRPDDYNASTNAKVWKLLF